MKCPICGGRHVKPVKKLFDDRYGYDGEFRLLSCESCDHLYLENTFTYEEITDIYTRYYPRAKLKLDQHLPHKPSGNFTSWLNGEKSSSFRWVPENITILDIGCGFGQSLAYHKLRGCNVYGVEADENIKRVVDKYGYKVHVGSFNADLYETEFFDYVTLDQVIEHFIDPLGAINGISKILKSGGYLIMSTPNVKGWGARLFGKKWINWHAPYHLHHFSKKSIEQLADQGGFYIEQDITKTNSAWLYYQLLHLLTYPEYGVPSSFWGPSFSVPQEKKLWFKAIVWLHKMKITHVLTRIFDTFGYGDNKVYFLRKK